MKTLLKAVLACVALVVVAIGIALAYIFLALDPNSYKPQLEQAARDRGVELDIAGDLGWSLWPNLAITLGETRFSGEDHGIQPSSLQGASLVLSWRELLGKRIAVKALALDGADLHLTSIESGAVIAAAPTTGDRPIEGTGPDGQSFSLAVDKLTIANSRLRLDQDGEALVLDAIDLATSEVSVNGDAFPLTLSFRYHPEDGEAMAVSLTTTASYNQNGEQLGLENFVVDVHGLLPVTLRLAMTAAVNLADESAAMNDLVIDLGDTRLQGNATLGYGDPLALNLALKGTHVNLDELLAKAQTPEATSDSTADSEPVNPLAPLLAPLLILDGGSGQISLTLDSLVTDGLTLTSPQLRLSANNRILTVENISAGVFDGTLNSQAVINTSTAIPTLRFSASLDNINLVSALDQFADDMDLAGTLAMTIEGSTRGENSDSLLANLVASGNLQVANPHLGNVNVEQSYCELAALIERSGRRETPWPKGTSLNDLSSNFRIDNQTLHLDDYSTGMGNISLRGDGEIHLDRQSFDIRAITRLNGDRTSAEGCEVKSTRVRDRDIPFVCKDRFADASAASCKPDQDFVRNLLQNEVLDRLRGDDGDEGGSLEDRLRGLFRR